MSVRTLIASLLADFRHDACQTQLWHYRVLCLITAFLVPCMGLIQRYAIPAAVDPSWMRLAFTGAWLAAFYASHLSAWVRRRFSTAVHMLLYVMTLWFVVVVAWNDFEANYALGLLFLIFVIAITFGIGLRRLKLIVWYLAFALPLTALALLTTAAPQVDRIVFMSLLAGTALVVLIAAHWNVQAQASLAASEQRFRAATEGSPDVFFMFRSVRDAAGALTGFALVDLDTRAERFIGRSRGKAIGQSLHTLLHAIAPAEQFFVQYARVVDTGETLEEERVLPSGAAGGEAMWLHHQAVRVEDGVAVTLRDITQRKQTQQELVEVNTFYRQILDNMPLQTALYDAEGRYTYVSASAVRDPEMRRFLVGRTDVDYCRRRGKDLQFGRERTALIQGVVRTGEEVRFEEPISTPEGAQKHYRRVISPVFGPDGQEVTHVLGYGIDLTRHVQAEKALRASEMRYRTLMEAANEAIFVADADTGLLTDANWTAQDLVGRSIDELRQMHQSELHPPEKRAAYEEIFQQHVLDGTANHEEMYVIDRGGDWTPVEVNARVVTIEDERAIVAVFHDVTHRQRYERQLIEAKERAEELLKLKTSLLTNVSHEFRTPLSGIIGFADILAEESAGQQKEFAEMMALSARRLHTTLDAVLDLAQLESGNVPLHPSEIDLRAEVREAARSFRGRAEEKGLFLRIEHGDGPATARRRPGRTAPPCTAR